MQVYVTKMRFHGKALEQHQIRTADAVWGDVVISHSNVPALGRYADVASIQKGEGGQDPLPPLYDVRISAMGSNGFVLSGIELAGTIAFAQAWWCRPKD